MFVLLFLPVLFTNFLYLLDFFSLFPSDHLCFFFPFSVLFYYYYYCSTYHGWIITVQCTVQVHGCYHMPLYANMLCTSLPNWSLFRGCLVKKFGNIYLFIMFLVSSLILLFKSIFCLFFIFLLYLF